MTHHNTSLNNMIKQQLRTGNVLDDNILELFRDIPRHDFVPKNMQAFAYSDQQIPLAHQQRMLTPLEEGTILQSLNLRGHETVLEIGTGNGYLTALLSRLCKKVISIDCFEDFSQSAAAQLEKHQCNNVELITADGSAGWLDKAPYDAVVITGAIELISEMLLLQILPEGKLFAIVGQEPVMQGILYTLKDKDNWTQTLLFETCVPPLISAVKQEDFIF